jgi:hypothetical protein
LTKSQVRRKSREFLLNNTQIEDTWSFGSACLMRTA